MRNLLVFLGCALFTSTSCAQLRNATFKLAVNYPYIPTVAPEVQQSVTVGAPGFVVQWQNWYVRETYDTKPGIDLGFNVDVLNDPLFYINTGVALQYFSYHRHLDVIANEALITLSPFSSLRPWQPYGTIIGTYADTTSGSPIIAGEQNAEILQSDPSIGRTTVLYVQVPMTIGKTFLKEKLRVQVGITPSVLLYATQYEPYATYSGGQYHTYATKNKSTNGFTKLMMNGIFETSYQVTKRIGIGVNYQRSFTPIYEAGNRPGGKAIFNTFSFGVSYRAGK